MNVVPILIRCTSFPPLCRVSRSNSPQCEFHILGDVREKYQFDESLFSVNGNVIFPNFHAARVFAKKMNDARDLVRFPEQGVKAGQLNALGLIDEIFHYILRVYEETVNPGVFGRAQDHLVSHLGKDEVQSTIDSFVGLFPPLDVYKKKSRVAEYVNGTTAGRANRQIALEELILLYLTNFNPAAAKFNELFSDKALCAKTKYPALITALEQFFKTEKTFGPEHQFIFDLLRAPMLAHPDSLEAQLGYIKTQWGMLLSAKFLDRILGGLDLLQEENKIVFGGGGVAFVPAYDASGSPGHHAYGSLEAERFTADLDWMPKVVLLAKNTYVWLDQLSKKYRRSISRLNEIPDEELDQLARWNFTGLWLIGLWERSNASRKIKQWTGNPEAVPSAYSLYDYEIAWDLGGEEAFQNLSRRAWQRGIRLAGDMVPNHMGIYSKWVIEHPEYFIQSDVCPFPNYRFTGGDLSENPGVQIRVEDGYWSRTDAAVVFQRIDNGTGKITYVYHGNDGTNMPWNDTAQLDLLRSDVREAVIQTIFHVAQKFSIIRFDAAMTLTKKHFQRLWYPQPGTGGDIPSRADRAMSKEEFDRLFPSEFWRDVVDRINEYMPSTLLLAEAFWLMEGYFVRTLGMHRVYNSAFMHMLMKEENEKYHQLIKNTLAYNPEILKRYVNFMSNPDEQTAIAQFGKDDKYFGVALMMVTLPGLPMFGHGQIEGFTEKYGMEYKRAYYDEVPDNRLVLRHEHELFPIMKRRHLFSDVTNFEHYDFHDSHGHVDPNVFAYSNMSGGERALIFYHNKYRECKGWIKFGSMKLSSSAGGEKRSEIRSLGQALALNSDDKHFYIFKDYKSGLEYIRSGRELHEKGMYAELRAFEYHAFLDFREVYDEAGEYSAIARTLHGAGVDSIHQSLVEMRQAPVHDAVKALLSEDNVASLRSYCLPTIKGKIKRGSVDEIFGYFSAFVRETEKYTGAHYDVKKGKEYLQRNIENLSSLWQNLQPAVKPRAQGRLEGWQKEFKNTEVYKTLRQPARSGLLLSWLVGTALTRPERNATPTVTAVDLFTQINLEKVLLKTFSNLGRNHEQAKRDVCLLEILVRHQHLLTDADEHNRFMRMEKLFDDYDVREYVKVNLYHDTWFYNKECFEEMLGWLFVVSVVNDWHGEQHLRHVNAEMCSRKITFVNEVKQISDRSQYDIDRLRKNLSLEE
ncbi:MAG TPA: alpha-amylase family glycosyl hydrolase [Bacteroidota bacterium]|nr:alpha-amylase family glycosyl hydrolase [Bacteroidota bacterium]